MDGEEIRKRMLQAYGIRVEPEMSNYVARRLLQAGAALGGFYVIGGEARTGTPMRMMIDPAVLRQPAVTS